MTANMERIRNALEFIPAGGHDERVRVAFMLKSEFGDSGRDLWDFWRDGRGDDEAGSVWKSASETGPLKIGTLIHEAKAHGWRDAETYQRPTPEQVASRKFIEAERAELEQAEIARERERAAENAATIWRAATVAKADHPYLERKQITPALTIREIDAHTVKVVLGYAPKSDGVELVGRLLVVPVKQRDTLSTLELVDESGRKAALAGRGTKSGGYWATQPLPQGDGEGYTLLIGEGVATVFSPSSVCGHTGVAALSSGNLLAVAKYIRERFPKASLVILADLVKATGEADPHAIEAARVVGGKLAIPDFGVDRAQGDKDFNDLHVLRGADAVKGCIKSAGEASITKELTADDNEKSTDDEERESQASALVRFVATKCTLFHDANKDCYAKNKITNETRRLDSRSFKDWLVAEFYITTEKAARDQSLREATAALSGMARHRGELVEVNIRVAKHGDSYFLDLAEPGNSRAVRVKAGRWDVVNDPPVHFLRPESMQPLPEPKAGRSVDGLWKVVNIPGSSRQLVLAYLIECLRPDTPFPILELFGEQGSAKSTTQTFLRRMLDPNACDLRSAPKTAEDVFVGAGVNWLVSYENISHLPAVMQDALCVLSTGGGFAKRKLFSDADESVINVKRPVMLNGISIAVTAQDLLDRTVSIEMPTIHERLEVGDVRRQFNETHGALLGGLLDVMARALERLPSVSIPPERRPRLAEFARLGMAVAESVGGDGDKFLTHFHETRKEAIERTIDASPVATAVIEWIGARPEGMKSAVKDIFREVERFKPQQCDAWPRSPKGFADALRRIAPPLRVLGISCICHGKQSGFGQWEIRKFTDSSGYLGGCKPRPSPESPNVLPSTPREQDFETLRTSSRLLSPEYPVKQAEIEGSHVIEEEV